MNNNPFYYGSSISDSEKFIGRTQIIKELIGRICKGNSKSENVSIVGKRRIGKSSLLSYIYQNQSNFFNSDKYMITFIDFQNDISENPRDFFINLIEEIHKQNNLNNKTKLHSKTLLQIKRELKRTFEYVKLEQKKNSILFFDEFEAILESNSLDSQNLNFLRSLANDPLNRFGVSFIICSRTSLYKICDSKYTEMMNSSKFPNIFCEIELCMFEDYEVDEFFQKYMFISKNIFSNFDIQKIRNISGNYPYFLQFVSSFFYEKIFNENIEFKIEDILNVLYYKTINEFDCLYNSFTEEEKKCFINPYENKSSIAINKIIENKYLKFIDNEFIYFSSLFKFYLEQIRKKEFQNLLNLQENEKIEFKSSLRWNIETQKCDKEIEKVIIKTITGFLNSSGGSLYIGITNEKKIVGLKKDFITFTKRPNCDGFELHLRNLIERSLGKKIEKNIIVKFKHYINNNYICIVEINKNSEPVFIEKNGNKIFYVRLGNSTKELGSEDIHKYISENWK